MSDDVNGWNKWSKHVIVELERLNGCYTTLDNKLDDVRIEIAKLKVKAGVWGAFGGAIPVAIALGVWAVEHFG